MDPFVSVRVPVTISVSPLGIVFVPVESIVKLLNVSEVETSIVADAPSKTTVPVAALKLPPAVWVKVLAKEVVPELAVKDPPEIVKV
jgi:hypothetical protein